MSSDVPLDVPSGSIWYDTYNYGNGTEENARIVRVEDVDEDPNYVRVRAVGGTNVSPQALGRVTRARIDRFNRSGGYRPATQTTHMHVNSKFKEPYVDKNFTAKKKPQR